MASTAMRLAILAACADAFQVLIDGRHFGLRRLDHFSKRKAAIALRQPPFLPDTVSPRRAKTENGNSG